MPKNLKLTLQILIVLVACLASFQLIAAEQQTASEDSRPAIESEALDAQKAPVAGCSTGDEAELDFAAFDPDAAWAPDAMSCRYTCPFGMAALCPDRIDHTKACVNGCCVWYPI